jgi:hypothetical protein
MNDSLNLHDRKNEKNQKLGVDKIFHPLDVHFDTNVLFSRAWSRINTRNIFRVCLSAYYCGVS